MFEDENTSTIVENDPPAAGETSSAGYTASPAAEDAPSVGYSSARFETKPEKKRKGMSVGGIIALALICSLLGGLLGAGGMVLASRGAREAEIVAETPTPAATEAPAAEKATAAPTAEPAAKNAAVIPTASMAGYGMTAAEVYEQNVNSAVGITTSVTTNYWGYQSTYPASGSGFIIREDGYILTNYHVIEDSSSITVTTFDNKTYDAEIVGYDTSNDIAVLKIDAKGLQPVKMGSSDSLRVGDTVITIGNPLGELTFSLTQGVVSALNREVTFSSGTTMALIQTDAAINSGNSGGPLFNMNGEVVGITNAKFSSRGSSSSASIDNIGFAIPIDRVRGIVDSIIDKGYISKPFIGVSVASVNSELQSFGIPQGAVVKAVNEDSPAEKAGLQINDVITSANGKAITSSSDLVNAVSACSPGDELALTVYRQKESADVTITVIVGEQQRDAKAEVQNSQQSQYQGRDESDSGNQDVPGGSGRGDQGGTDSFPFPFGFSFGF